MDEFIKRMSERLAAQSSRRGFFSKVEKALLGTMALITGQGFFAQAAEAASLQCCTGRSCGGGGCPSGTRILYTWTCHSPSGHYTCYDCFHKRRYVCTFAL
jgi:hypothetical protein